ncbi:MAG: AHH domain-containing protein [Pseudomonadota bacterium]
MTQLGEAALIAKILEHKHDEEECPFCQKNEEVTSEGVSSKEQDWDEDERTQDSYWTARINNDPGQLEKNMAKAGEPRPSDWDLQYPVYDCSGQEIELPDDHTVTPNPHHLIPGNESLKQSKQILRWIYADAEDSEIESDINYDINNAQNGVWLPSNNAMRRNQIGSDVWECDTVKITYANAAQPGRGCFHDRHADYSRFAVKLLNKIANKMGQQNMVCQYNTEKGSEKHKPPYALVTRLNGVSLRLKSYLTQFNPDGFQPPLYTSKLVEMRVKIIKEYDDGRMAAIDCKFCKK